jgi:hypothetical protein
MRLLRIVFEGVDQKVDEREVRGWSTGLGKVLNVEVSRESSGR